MTSKKMGIMLVLAIILSIGAFYLTTIRSGHDWGDDFSMYIHHAKNIANNSHYGDTGYIYNPFYPSLGPKIYPWGFPFLLSPIYKWFGMNLTLMKSEIIIVFAASLFIIFLVFRNQAPPEYSIVMIALIGFNPYFWNFKDNILSDMPFLFFLYMSFLFINQAQRSAHSPKKQLWYSILAGLFTYLSFATRSLGILIVTSLFIYDLIQSKKLTKLTLIVSALFFSLIIFQNNFLPGDVSYLDQLVIRPDVIFNNLRRYATSPSLLWANGYSNISGLVLFTLISVLAIVGYIKKAAEKMNVPELFVLFYVAVIIIWPAYQGMRFLIPIIPFYIFYAFIGVQTIFPRQKKIEKAFSLALLSAILISNAAKYTKLDYGPVKEGIHKKESLELFSYIKEKTAQKDIFIFRKPRALALFSERAASTYHMPKEDEHLWNYFCKINANYIVVSQVFSSDQQFLQPFIDKYNQRFQITYCNDDFKVYKIISK